MASNFLMNRAGDRSVAPMRPVEIKEFSLSTEIEYRHAVMFGSGWAVKGL